MTNPVMQTQCNLLHYCFNKNDFTVSFYPPTDASLSVIRESDAQAHSIKQPNSPDLSDLPMQFGPVEHLLEKEEHFSILIDSAI